MTDPSRLPTVLAFSPETSILFLSYLQDQIQSRSSSQFLNLNFDLKLPATTPSSIPELAPRHLRVSQREEEKTSACLSSALFPPWVQAWREGIWCQRSARSGLDCGGKQVGSRVCVSRSDVFLGCDSKSSAGAGFLQAKMGPRLTKS